MAPEFENMPGEDIENSGFVSPREIAGGAPTREELEGDYQIISNQVRDLQRNLPTVSIEEQRRIRLEISDLTERQTSLVDQAVNSGYINENEINNLANYYMDFLPQLESGEGINEPQAQEILRILRANGLEAGSLQRKIQSLIAQIPGQGVETPKGHIKLSYESDFGRREVDVPRDRAKQREILTDALALLERTREPEGDLAYTNAIRRFNLMIAAMQQRHNPIPVKDENGNVNNVIFSQEATKLVDEYRARVAMHQIYIGYSNADDLNAVKAAVEVFRTSWLDTFFTTKDYRSFRYALQYYTDNGAKFMGADNLTEKDKEREMLGQTEFRNNVKQYLMQFGFGSNPEEVAWAQNLAERFWEVTGKRVSQVGTHNDEKGKMNWNDTNIEKGNFAVRDVLKFPERILTRKDLLRPFFELFEGAGKDDKASLDAQDYISYLTEKLITQCEAQVEEKIKGEKNEKELTDEEREDLNKKREMELESRLSGVIKFDKDRKYKDKNKKARDQKIDFTNDDFWEGNADKGMDKFKFYSVENSEHPTGYWAYRYLSRPEGARTKILTYLQRPTDENFLEAAKTLDYLGADQYDIYKTLIRNRVNFLLKSSRARIKEAGLGKANLAGADTMIEYLGIQLKQKPDEIVELAEQILGPGAWVDTKIFWSHIKGNKVLSEIFLALVLGILKQGLQLK